MKYVFFKDYWVAILLQCNPDPQYRHSVCKNNPRRAAGGALILMSSLNINHLNQRSLRSRNSHPMIDWSFLKQSSVFAINNCRTGPWPTLRQGARRLLTRSPLRDYVLTIAACSMFVAAEFSLFGVNSFVSTCHVSLGSWAGAKSAGQSKIIGLNWVCK